MTRQAVEDGFHGTSSKAGAKPAEPTRGAEVDVHEADWYRTVYAGDHTPQLTWRAVLMGSALGSLMSVAALYTALKIGWSFGVAITACVLSYASWNGLRVISGGRLSKMSILENNCMQSTASAAGYSTGSTVTIAVAATLLITGVHFHWTVLVPLVLFSGLLGVFLAIPIKRQLINIERLRYPSGVAAAETLKGLYSEGKDAARTAYTLIGALAVGAVVGVLKAPSGIIHWLDSLIASARVPRLLPFDQGLACAITAGQGRAFLGFGLDPSLLLLGAGMITGLRVSLSMLAGSTLLYFVVGPRLVAMDESAVLAAAAAGTTYTRHVDLIQGGTIVHLVRWALWGSCSLMVVASLMSLLFQAPTIVRSFRFRGRETAPSADPWTNEKRRSIEVPLSWLWIAVPPLALGLIILQSWAFGTPWILGALAVVLSFLVAMVCARVTGETDTVPAGPMAKLMQLIYALLPGAAGNQTINLMTAGVTTNAGFAAADLLTDLKSGYVLGANPRRQFWAQFIGVFVGTASIVIGWYLLVPDKQALETYNAPAAQSWRAFSEALTKGLTSIPDTAQIAAVAAAVLGIILPTLERVFPKARPYLPSAMGLGLSWVVPFSNSLSFAIGALLVWVWGRLSSGHRERYSLPVASGLIAGESMFAAVIAILATLAARYPWMAGTPPIAP